MNDASSPMSGSIVDLTTGKEIAACCEVASNPWTRFRGLMLRSSLAPGEALLIRPCGSIHMFFMRFSIDAVFLDADGRVTRVASRLRPWLGMAFGGRGAKVVIELPAGAAHAVARGHMLQVQAAAMAPEGIERTSQVV